MEMSVGNTWLFSIFRYDCFLSALTWSSKKESNFSTSSICFLCALLHFSSCSTRETWCLSKWWLWLSAGSIREKILFSWSFTSIVNSKNWWIHFELSFIISPKTAPIVLIRERYIPSQQLRCSSHHCSNCSTFEVSSTDEWVLFDFTFSVASLVLEPPIWLWLSYFGVKTMFVLFPWQLRILERKQEHPWKKIYLCQAIYGCTSVT